MLGAGQEHVCRAFVTKAPDRFDVHGAGDTAGGSPGWPGPCSGSTATSIPCCPPVTTTWCSAGSATWESPRTPVCPCSFVRGGYGSPNLPSIQTERPEFANQLRLANLVRPEAEAVSGDLGLECLVSAAVGNSVVSLAAAGIGAAPGGSDTRVGTAFPLAAPIAPLFVAWAGRSSRWPGSTAAGGSPGPATPPSRWPSSRPCVPGATRSRPVSRTPSSSSGPWSTTTADGVAEVLRRMQERAPEPRLHTPFDQLTDVASLAAPVRGADGSVLLSLHLIGFTGSETPQRLRSCLDRLLAGAARASHLLT